MFPLYNEKHMRHVFCIGFIVLSSLSVAQSPHRSDDFSITLERIGCLGICPDYKVTILGSGAVRYEGRFYVRVKGVRQTTVPVADVKGLIQKLRDENFFHWKERTVVCVDYPEVLITATLNGRRKHVLEGCRTPGKILELANEIDRISGAKSWGESVLNSC
jgi:hypothetical protein